MSLLAVALISAPPQCPRDPVCINRKAGFNVCGGSVFWGTLSSLSVPGGSPGVEVARNNHGGMVQSAGENAASGPLRSFRVRLARNSWKLYMYIHTPKKISNTKLLHLTIR